MKITSSLDLAVHVETVRSIEVMAQGCYYLKFEAFFNRENEKIPAVPYNIIIGGQRSASILAPSSIDNDVYNSQIFMVKFFDEIIPLNEICFFRIDHDVTDEDFQVTFQCKLLGLQCFSYSNTQILENISHSQDFSVKIEKEFFIINPNRGFHSFLPVYFSQNSFLLINLSVHSILSGYSLDRNTQNFPSYSKIKFKDIESQLFIEAVFQKFFQDSEKVSKRQIFQVYEKVILKFLKYYEKNRIFLLEFWEVQDLTACSVKLLDLSEEISKFQIGFEENSFHPNDSFTFLSSDQASKIIGRGLWSISKNLSHLQDFFIKTMQFQSKKLIRHLIDLFNLAQSEVFSSNKLKTHLICSSFPEAPSEDYSLRHSFINFESESKSKSLEIKNLFIFPKFHPEDKEIPFIFVDILSKSNNIWPRQLLSIQILSKIRKNSHLVVLVHGLYGSSQDMRVLRNLISKYFPCTSVMCSYFNEQKTEGNILKMGERLAKEVKKFLADNFYSDSLKFLSFIGYSLGGLIVRASLQHLSEYHPRLNFFISLSTPHLGCSISTSKLVEAGIWIIKKFKRCKSLGQLSMTDSKQFRSSFIYQLSQSPEIQHFNHLAFVSSWQDKYSPIDSSLCVVKAKYQKNFNTFKNFKESQEPRISKSFESENENLKSSKENIQSEIAFNILRLITAHELIRIDAKFQLEGKKIDKVLGRAAHIEMIDNPHFLELLLHECCHFFSDF